MVGIAPEFQRRGLGYGLVKPVLDEADLLNIPTYLETFSPGNMAFYERLGYQAVASFHEPVFDLHYWLMLRQPLGE
ncbi:MAG: hypothetical protein DSY91_04765 [Deltaproteobacteria bacterium]|nr:MAG: hypothetical protein DSY91_04765 [Deltaproteobacteria bacterium]